MKIIDNGKEYVYTTLSGEMVTIEYGAMLIRLGAILKNTNFHALYLGSSKPKYKPGQIDDKTANIFIEAMIKSTLANSSKDNDRRILEIFYDEEATPQRELITEVVKHELLMAEYQNGYDVISDKNISEEFERILMGENVDDDLIQKLLNLGEITYKAVYSNGTVVRDIELTSIGQIISLEIENVISRKNPDVIYRRCIQCGNIFVACGHAGNQDKLCSYKYTSGSCKKRRQEELDKNRDPYIVIDKKIYDSMYKRKDKATDPRSLGELHLWQEEYRNAVNLFKHNMDEASYEENAKKTWKSILKRINSEK